MPRGCCLLQKTSMLVPEAIKLYLLLYLALILGYNPVACPHLTSLFLNQFAWAVNNPLLGCPLLMDCYKIQ